MRLLAALLALSAPYLSLAPAVGIGALFVQRAQAAAISLPPAAPVVDEYQLLSSQEEAQLDQLVRQIKQKSGVEVTVYIASSLQDRAIEDFSIDVARAWGLGQKKEDRGLLLVIAPKEKQMRLEVGGGLEGDITDVFARHVLDDGLRPYFRQGRYFDGILSALETIQEKVPLGLDESDMRSTDQGSLPVSLRLLLLFLVVLWVLSRLARFGGGGGRWGGGGYYGGGAWGGGFSGGGSWGGGGGGFSGGGSSSSW